MPWIRAGATRRSPPTTSRDSPVAGDQRQRTAAPTRCSPQVRKGQELIVLHLRPAARLPIALLLLMLKSPGAVAADTGPPPAPDYSHPQAWAAWPGRPSDADLVAPGLIDAGLPEKEKVNVFFIHPTTYLSGTAANARFDEPGAPATRISHGVMRFQASVFNACCRIYAPRYRQANISAFQSGNEVQSEAEFELAYGDVLRAFEYFLGHEN